jgi:hypothetical protein
MLETTNDTTVTQVTEATVETLRTEVAEATGRAYGAERNYGVKLCSVLPTGWYKVEHADKGEDAKKVHAEKKALFLELKKVNHSNPSTIWARVRKYAQEHAEPKAPDADGVIAPTEAPVGARQNRSLTLRLVEELITLYKATKNADSLSDKERDCQTHMASALTAMGIDVATIE